jgi:hypothetical protein
MKNEKYTLVVVLALTLMAAACGPNDFVSTQNTTSHQELAQASSGLKVLIRNRLPEVPAANGVPTVIHLNGEVCSWTERAEPTSPESQAETTPALSECHTFSGTIHSGENETFLISSAAFEKIYQAGNGRVKFMFKSSAQSTNFYQGCLGSTVISSDFRQRLQMAEVEVQSQNSSWGYQCQVASY